MVAAGIEVMNVFGGSAFLDVMDLARHRALDLARAENLLMREKAVALPYEDAITYGVNAAKPLLDILSAAEKDRIEMLITCSETGIDFGKSMSTYIHHYLGLHRNCRLFEMKQACYSGTAGLQMAINFVLSQTSPGARALVVATDIARYVVAQKDDPYSAAWAYGESSSGAGAVAMLVGEQPTVLHMDVGASGYYGYEVMDTCRPTPDSEAGDPDVSLMAYLHCCEQAFLEYQRRVEGADYRQTFQYLAFHTPFGGMIKGAHRTMMHKMAQAKRPEIEADFTQRVLPGLLYCQRVGNIMSATVFLALAGIIDQAPVHSPQRIGLFSYGSGCCSEFYSGVITPASRASLRRFQIASRLDARYQLSIDEYEAIVQSSRGVKFGTPHAQLDFGFIPGVPASYAGTPHLVLQEINAYHRKYAWLS